MYGGVRGQKVGRIREQFIIAWVARWRYTTQDVLSIALGLSLKAVSDKLSRMEKHQLIRKVPVLIGKRGYVYILTTHGEGVFNKLSSRAIPSRMDASKLRTNTLMLHDLGVQIIVAYKWKEKSISQFYTQFDIKNMNTEHQYSIMPDALVISTSGSRVAIEFEATAKSKKRILGKFFDLRNDINRVEAGYIDRHHTAMQQWMDNKKISWEFVEYTGLTKGIEKSYREYVELYYKRRLNDQKNGEGELLRDGWVESFRFSKENIGELISQAIYSNYEPELELFGVL
jgi:DNA-binding MarR family transcriptional regulator